MIKRAWYFLGLTAVLGLAALALWLGLFREERGALAHPLDMNVQVASIPDTGTTIAQGSIISYTVRVTTDANPGVGAPLDIALSGANVVAASVTLSGGITCPTIAATTITCTVAATFAGGSVAFDATVTAVAPGPVLVGAALDPAVSPSAGAADEGLVGETAQDGGDDPDYTCGAVGEGTLPNTGPGGPTPPAEPDNFDCTSHPVGDADLFITKTAMSPTGATAATGSTITYSLIVTNAPAAPGIATNVLIRDWVGAPNLTFSSATPGAGVTCDTTAAPVIDCTVPALAPGHSVSVEIKATVAGASGTALLNGAYVDPNDAITETHEGGDDPALTCGTVGEGPLDAAAVEPDNYDCTSHTAVPPTPTPTPTPTVTATGTATATATATATPVGGKLLNCPLSGNWAISVWDGPTTSTGTALLTCTGVTIDAAYSLDRITNVWSYYFPGATINTLLTLSDLQAIFTLAR